MWRMCAICILIWGWTTGLCATDLSASHDERLEALYLYLHQNPELSFHEQNTARRMADELLALGFSVTENFGGTGVVGVLANGAGPTVLIRADMDALPVKEQTGLDYASTVVVTSNDGNAQPVMHACGHDIHMTVFVGTAGRLMRARDQWSGTLIMIAQPAEERGAGANAMLKAGLFTKFPRPDFNLALHVSAGVPAGKVGYVAGPALANVDSVDITVHGVGGHGAYPHAVRDPVVLAAEIVTAMQTIVSRELSPLEPAVLSVGSIHGGHKHNVIPDKVTMQLTLRSYTAEVRRQMIEAIKRISKNLAIAARMPADKMPEVVVKEQYTPVAYNDPELTHRLAAIFRGEIGADNVIELSPVMGGEDFGRYGQVEPKIPSLIYWLGAVDRTLFAKSKAGSTALPSLHSPLFAPEYRMTIRTGVRVMTAAALDLLGKVE